MKKITLIFLIVGAMLLAFAACDSGGGTKITTWTVTFNYNDNVTSSDTQTVVDGEYALNPGDPTRTDGVWFFIGWHFDNDGSDDIWVFNRIPVYSDVTLDAWWSNEACVVTFDSNGGSAVEGVTIGHGGRIPEPSEPTYAGYGFLGWYIDDDDLWDFDEEVYTNLITLSAKWGGPYIVGDTGPGGGVIFYADYPGDGEDLEGHGITILGYGDEDDEGYFATYTAYYLEFASGNASTDALWRASGNVLDVFTLYANAANGTGTGTPPQVLLNSIGYGKKDTQTIVTWFPTASSATQRGYATSNATYLARNYKDDYGKSDWFLPSIGELYLLRQSGVSGVPTTGTTYYWTSSQGNNDYAWRLRLNNGDRTYGNKNTSSNYVRAIRAF